MSFQKSTRTLKNEVLEICGELTDGTSDFETATLRYLNNVYSGLLSGGNEFGIDTNEPWVWAQSKRPINFSLLPSYSGSITLSTSGLIGALSSAPTISLEGYQLRVTNRSDIYRIVKHDAGTTDIQIDQPYLDTGGILAFTAYKTDYALTDDVIVIDQSNSKIDFKEATSGTLTATLLRGAYLPTDLCLAIKTAMQTVGVQTYTVSFSQLTRKFTIAQGGANFSLLWASGPNSSISSGSVLGFDLEDQTGAITYTGTYAQSAILRLTKPIQTYRSGFVSGLIYLTDDNSFTRDYSWTGVTNQMPDKFCLKEQNASGLWKIRMNASVFNEAVRCEVNYIPIPRKLVDSDLSFPLVPAPAVDFLIYAASHYLLTDKSDSKADQFGLLAQGKLKAMVSDNRKNNTLAGNDYARLVPRGTSTRRNWGW